MKKIYQKLAQWTLNQWGASPKLKEDGVFGAKSKKAAAKLLGISFDSTWRYVALILQKLCNKHEDIPELKEDAWWGPNTEDAARQMLVKMGWEEDEFSRSDAGESRGSAGGSTIRCWNPTTSQLKAAYGAVGKNQGMVQCPYVMRLDWDLDTVVTRFSAHTRAVRPFEAALDGVLKHYGIDKIRELGLDRFGGCLNVRKKRGGSTWSTHAWGIAIDLYPSRNKLKWDHNKALFARKDYRKFFEIFEDQGFVSLGRCYDFDWMHLQLNP